MQALALTLLLSVPSTGLDYDQMAKDAKDILAELVAADTTNPPGNEAKAVKLIARRLRKAGIPFEVSSFDKGRDNLVARVRGDGSQKPILLIAHLDVVGTDGQAWTSPPHKLIEKDGYLVGRGSGDDLSMAAVDLTLAIALARAKIPLHRDLVIAFTGDEESGGAGVRWLLAHHPEQLQAEVAFNEGGGPLIGEDGKMELLELQTAEKTYQDFQLTTAGTTGHSSVPLPGNAILALAQALVGVGDHGFPERLIPVTRAYFAARAAFETPPLAAAMTALAAAQSDLPADALTLIRTHPSLEAQLHTTCVPTLLSAGTRVNALPASAQANINCRILPGDTVEAVQAHLQEAAGPGAKVTVVSDFGSSGPVSPLDGPGPAAVLKAGQAVWPNVKVIPTMSTGADDSRFLRAAGIRAYGFHPIAMNEADGRRAHGIDERIPLASLRTGVELFHRLVMALNE